MILQDLDEIFDAIVGEGDDFAVVGSIDANQAVFGMHAEGKLMEQFSIATIVGGSALKSASRPERLTSRRKIVRPGASTPCTVIIARVHTNQLDPSRVACGDTTLPKTAAVAADRPPYHRQGHDQQFATEEIVAYPKPAPAL